MEQVQNTGPQDGVPIGTYLVPSARDTRLWRVYIYTRLRRVYTHLRCVYNKEKYNALPLFLPVRSARDSMLLLWSAGTTFTNFCKQSYFEPY